MVKNLANLSLRLLLAGGVIGGIVGFIRYVSMPAEIPGAYVPTEMVPGTARLVIETDPENDVEPPMMPNGPGRGLPTIQPDFNGVIHGRQ